MLESLTFLGAKSQGTKFVLGPIKNTWELGCYAFIEFYVTKTSLETQFLSFKDGMIVGKTHGTLEKAMRTALGVEEETQTKAGALLLPFTKSLMN